MRQSIKQSIGDFLERQSEESASYIIAVLAIAASLMAKLTGLTEYADLLYYLGAFALTYGFIVFVNSLVKPMVQSGLGKLILSGAFVIGSGISLAMARQTINAELHVPSSAFPITQSLLAVLLSPLTLSICLALTSVFFIIIGMLFSFMPVRITSMRSLLAGRKNNALSGLEIVTNIVRFTGLIVVISLAMAFTKENDGYTETLASFTKWFAYSFESETHSYCEIASGQRVTYLSEKLIVISKRSEDNDSYSFRVDKCISPLK
ncbi:MULTISPECIES: hypothetical protein [unclassified Neptuniibacter]|uniref:hypothetical protein n=1 Tax=unclassified Neptuniibacter TaxID=2630693 RepID=UPI000C4F1E1B|nr:MULTISPECIES: hypothetical protein [unclassified Neptuniibacter]MAY43507.1 hypothetical protein [Oceanospirillaceae bacterium]